MSIQDFITQVKSKGLARNNRYDVEVPVPVLLWGSNVDRDMLRLFCDSVTLPGINLATSDQKTYGEIREIPYMKIYDPVQTTFYVDTDMMVKQFFDAWTHGIIDPTTRQAVYYNLYITDVNIRVYDMSEQFNVYTVTLHEAYPKTISAVHLSHDSKDVMKLTVGWAYKWWTSSVGESTAPLQQSSIGDLNTMEDTIMSTTGINSLINNVPYINSDYMQWI